MFAAAALGLLWPAGASAQSAEYELDESGEWKEVRTPAPGTDEAVIAEARRELARDRPGRARDILDEWIGRNELGESPWLPAAYLLRAEARLARDDHWAALYDLERIIRLYPASEEFAAAVEREVEIGLLFTKGTKRKLWGMRIVPAKSDGAELLIRAQERLPGSALAERAAIELADYYFNERDIKLAREAYDLYILNYPRGPNLAKALERRIITNIALFKGPEHDASSLIDAREQALAFARVFPAEAEARGMDATLVDRIDESTAAQLLAREFGSMQEMSDAVFDKMITTNLKAQLWLCQPFHSNSAMPRSASIRQCLTAQCHNSRGAAPRRSYGSVAPSRSSVSKAVCEAARRSMARAPVCFDNF